MKSIAIITDELNSRLIDTRYFVGRLAKFWERKGVSVRTTAGCNFVPADLAIMHVDTSVVADEYLELARRYPVTLNGSVRSILKSDISRNLVQRHDAYDGPVIVKTNANYGGINEYRIRKANRDPSLIRSGVLEERATQLLQGLLERSAP